VAPFELYVVAIRSWPDSKNIAAISPGQKAFIRLWAGIRNDLDDG